MAICGAQRKFTMAGMQDQWHNGSRVTGRVTLWSDHWANGDKLTKM